MTKKELELLENHYKMWDWLVKHPKKDKHDYLDKFDKGLRPACYLCIFDNIAGYCPINIVNPPRCNCEPYWEYNNAETIKERVFYAKLIRDVVLPYIE